MGASLIRARASQVDVCIVYGTGSPAIESAQPLPEVRREYLQKIDSNNGASTQITRWLSEIGPATVFIPSPLWGRVTDRSFATEVESALANADYDGALWAYDFIGDAPCNCFLDVSSYLDEIKAYSTQYPEFDWAVLLSRLLTRARQIQGVSAAEGFWAADHFSEGGILSDFVHSALSFRPSARELSAAVTVSIIIRTRDRPDLLNEALASLLSQQSQSLEILVINDGGSSVENVTKQFISGMRISLIEHTAPIGRVAAANLGIQRAAGTWIAILDDDDIYLPGGIDALITAAKDTSTVYHGAVDFVQYGERGRQLLRRFGAPYDSALMAFENQIPFIGCLMPRVEVLAVGGLDESLDCFEDWDLYLRLAKRCRFEYIDKLVAEYRSFGATFASGRGGVAQQISGLSKIYAKHLRCGEAALLADAHIAVKQKMIPRLIQLEAWEAVRHAREIDLSKRESAGPGVAVTHSLRVSLIVVNYNGRHHLEKCIPSLMSTRGVAMDVIIVDNASKDDSVAWLRSNWPQITVISEKINHGFGRGNQIGIEAAKSGYVALLNSDTIVTPDWLTRLIEPLLLHPEIGASCSQLRLLARPELLNARGGGMSRLGFGYDIDAGFPYIEADSDVDAQPKDVLFPSGAAMLVRKHEFLAIGGFDPAMFMYHEDVDLGWRYWLNGQRVVMCPRSIVFHAFGGTTKVERDSTWRHVMGNRHNLRSIWKNYALRRALGATYRLYRGWLRSGHLGFAWAVLSWNLRHAPGTLRERRRIQRNRRVTDHELFERGLITLYVPPQPDLSVVLESARQEPLLISNVLWPGRSSALGRLGPGWYIPERIDGIDVRATTGRAFARIQVGAGEIGRLFIKMHVPSSLCKGRAVSVRCNESQTSQLLDPDNFWNSIEIPAQARADGLLNVMIDVPSWVSHQEFHNGDMRRLGAFIHQIKFEGSKPLPIYKPNTVTVLITTYKRWPILARTLEALKHQSWPHYEVIVVDDGSSDGTWENLQNWKNVNSGDLVLKVFTQNNTGQGIARNYGLQFATGDIVLFIGDDTIPEPDFIEQHIAKHLEVGMPCAVVGYTQWDREGMHVTPFLEYVNEGGHQFGYRYMLDGNDVPYTCFYTSNVSLPREIMGQQPFDPNFRTYGWEDIDLGLRLSRRGLRIVYNAQARVHHCHPMFLRHFYERQIKVGASIGTIYTLHPELVYDPLMPVADRPRIWKRFLRICVPLMLPVVSWLDTHRVRLPERVYRFILSDGFWIGRDRAQDQNTTAKK
ncbi:glycosyltransferase [Thiomonas sp.]|uniref:glycosyltransferase n=1 Tax=Thiomonas sp. TaxID=2047785 RepID=UPI002A35904A|nr:glycosyltransferase [Thiomonas sp.]